MNNRIDGTSPFFGLGCGTTPLFMLRQRLPPSKLFMAGHTSPGIFQLSVKGWYDLYGYSCFPYHLVNVLSYFGYINI